jgi:hypothetical protein
MFVRSSINQSQGKGLIVFSLLLAVLVTFSVVQIMAADGGRTAVNANAPQESGAVLTETIPVDRNSPLAVTESLSATGAVTTYTL